MSYQVLARKWRPQIFEDVIGQSHVTRTIQNAIKTKRIGHAYIFTGPRGIGKTTTARLLAKALNCEKGPTPTPCNKCSNCIEISENRFPDVIEIDGASNNSVDDIRDLIERVNYRPAKGRYKIYIIDEVHMLSTSAFNALLKTLEEPPSHVIFVFATTEPHKIPATIMSRCQRFDFRKIPENLIIKRLKFILGEEGITYFSEDSLKIIARAADGSLRDALSILDQALSLDPELKRENLEQVLGLTSKSIIREITASLIHKDTQKLSQLIQSNIAGVRDIKNFFRELLIYIDELIKIKFELISGEESDKDLIKEIDKEELFHLFNMVNKVVTDSLSSPFPELKMEVGLISIASRPPLVSIEKLIEKLEKGVEISVKDKRTQKPRDTTFPPSSSDNFPPSSMPPVKKHGKNLSPFENFKNYIKSKKPFITPLISLMQFNPQEKILKIIIASSRHQNIFSSSEEIMDFIHDSAEKFLGKVKIVVENKFDNSSSKPKAQKIITPQDIEAAENLQKILEEFEGRITKIIPEGGEHGRF